MKKINKVIFGGKNFLSLFIISLTLISLISTNIATNIAIKSYNLQVIENNLVDLSYRADYDSYQKFNQSDLITNTFLPIINIFCSISSSSWNTHLSENQSLNNLNTEDEIEWIFVLSTNLSMFQFSPFEKIILNPNTLNSSGGVYISPRIKNLFNLSSNENFSLYTTTGNDDPVITDSVKNLTLAGEITIADPLQFSQMFGIDDYLESFDYSFGIIIMDPLYFDEKFRTESGEPILNIGTLHLINYIFDKTDIIDKNPARIERIFYDISQTLYSHSLNKGYNFYFDDSPLLDRISEFKASFTSFRVFLIITSFPLYLFGWWTNRISTSYLLERKLRSLDIFKSKGVPTSTIKKKMFLKSLIIGVGGWVVSMIVSQFFSFGIQSFMFSSYTTFQYDFFSIFNLYTMITLPFGIGISMLSANSAFNSKIKKIRNITQFLDNEEEIPNYMKKQSVKRGLRFLVLSLMPLTLLIIPILDIFEINVSGYVFLNLISSGLSLLSLLSGYFIVLGLLNILSSNAKKVKKFISKKYNENSLIKSIVLKRSIRGIKHYGNLIFIITIAILIVSQTLTYNAVYSNREYEINLLQNGNGFKLSYTASNSSFSLYNKTTKDIEQNTELNQIICNNIDLFQTTADVDIIYYHTLNLLDPSKWMQMFELPRNWLSSTSENIFQALERNNTILVPETFLEKTDFEIGDSFEFIYLNISGIIKTREVEIIGSYYRFPLITSTDLKIPSANTLISNIYYFADIHIGGSDKVFYTYPEVDFDLYDLFISIREQIYFSDPSGQISSRNTDSDYDLVEPSFPFFGYLQIEAINISLIVFLGLTIILKRQTEKTTPNDKLYRFKGMRKKMLHKIRLWEILLITIAASILFLPSFLISLISFIGINQLNIVSSLPYRIVLPIFKILIVVGGFILLLIGVYSIILSRNQKTDKTKSIDTFFS